MNELLPLAPLIGLYAETHYRFRCFPFSLYYRRQPEIIFDAPHRLEPGESLPVTLIIKDADRFPVEVEEVVLSCRPRRGDSGADTNRQPQRVDGLVAETRRDDGLEVRVPINRLIECSLWHQILEFDIGKLPPGELELTATATVRIRGRRFQIKQDNYAGLSQRPLKVFKAEDPLPLLPGWVAGELHCHTSYGPDQVEFGAPLEVIKRNAQALGHSFAAVTDHSYNLNDLPDNYLKTDPELIKWQLLQEEAARLNRSGGVQIIAGEELSCRSSEGRNVHLLIIGNPTFLRGGGDSAEKWLRTRSEFSVAEALAQISPEALAIAAHPFAVTPWLERLLVHRGEWKAEDLAHPRLDGWQIANGSWEVDFVRGYEAWMRKLKEGRNVRIYGGNDAHGNFNRYRQVGLPMLRLRESDGNIFGRFTTRVMTEKRRSEELIAALKQAPLAISDGPQVELIPATDSSSALIRWKSSPEFGRCHSLKVYWASENGAEVSIEQTGAEGSLEGEIALQLPIHSSLRAELRTRTPEGSEHRCYTCQTVN